MTSISDAELERRLEAVKESGGNITQAALALGVGRKALSVSLITARAQHRIPDGEEQDGLLIKGTSKLYGADGEVKQTWVKTEVDRERQEEMARAMVAGLTAKLTPALPIPAPQTEILDQLSAYILGDVHLGLYSWAAQTGEDFDTIIAKRDLVGAADTLIRAAPASKRAIIVNLGDFFHADSQAGETPKSHNRLDTDTRWAHVIRVGTRVTTYMIDAALRKHDEVEYIPIPGNHDPNAAIMFGEIIRAHYRNEPRVKVDNRPKSFRSLRFGNCLIGLCHGDGGKPEEYAGMLSVEAREDWGRCDFRYVWHGHLHHRRMIEKLGTIVECFRTLAARDQWHAHNGYLAGREMQQITLHKNFGEIGRCVASLKQIREAA